MEDGEAMAYALNMVQERGRLMVEPGDKIYKGMIVGENARENDIPVNPCKAKRLTNMRSQGDGKGIQLDPPLKMSLERALEYIGADEYVEATPKNCACAKKYWTRTKRKRAAQSGRATQFENRWLVLDHENSLRASGQIGRSRAGPGPRAGMDVDRGRNTLKVEPRSGSVSTSIHP
jgi:hypothetical protein